ncbi:glycoside hydrolase family 16 protein [Fictibacillus sp. BK138]|uniref:glycoside hydrolase family 16 protein n=1 Tax=Fictibacillus sp. BK138 TaxID=2512121 RepID=UPI001029E47A|nr:glycoside hydrolase family 16 protein [Fictibacillus sp. BK138]RZT21359.1 glycosyl hydrolase family 16 [Fictibacillus sp. BK138]
MKRLPSVTFITLIIIIFLLNNSSTSRGSIISPSSKKEEMTMEKVQKELLVTSTGKWKLIYYEDFHLLDSNIWTVVERGNNYNNELQFYRKENVEVSDGSLRLVAREENYKKHKYTSGQINTKDKLKIHYGKIDIRLKYTEGKGLFPAVWLLPSNNKKNLPEIDIFESIGQDPAKVYMVNHYGNRKNYSSDYEEFILKDYKNYHTYTLEWDEKELRWYIDNELRFSNKNGVPQEPMYLILNLAVGGNWPGNPNKHTLFPASMNVDYVKIYKSNNQGD